MKSSRRDCFHRLQKYSLNPFEIVYYLIKLGLNNLNFCGVKVLVLKKIINVGRKIIFSQL